jgi:hypothetical protein
MEGFKGTICKVAEFDYLVRRINGQELAEVKAARDALETVAK